jgi:DNA-binding XRE family transcriptional regulator
MFQSGSKVVVQRPTKPSKYFVDNFCAAIKRARVNAGLTQEEMAQNLGIPRGSYDNYENRSLMPLHLIGRFCMYANTTLVQLFDQANNPPA